VKHFSAVLWAIGLLLALGAACAPGDGDGADREQQAKFEALRKKMVRDQLADRGIADTRVLGAMETVPRHAFVPPDKIGLAYSDRPIPLGEGQRMQQPYIVALMSEALQLKGGEQVLEIGTGSGYQAAILATLAEKVYSIEIIENRAMLARQRLAKLGFDNVRIEIGDGYRGWQAYSPFDAIIVTAAPDHVPEPLVDQLRTNGRMVIPVGKYFQELRVLTKNRDGTISEERIIPVKFGPMEGDAERQ
jgi:protein-L-isoaspartate(D-aspartate) O-methyltransferase